MARSHVTRHRPGQVPARLLAGRLAGRLAGPERLVRAVVAMAAISLCGVLPLLARPADAQPGAHGQPATVPLTLTVTSVSPSYAEQGQQITITGRVRNNSGSTASGLTVQLVSSRARLASRLELENFAAGTYLPGGAPVSTAPVTRQSLGAGQSWNWTVSFPASALGLSCFGVYPLTAEISDTALDYASDPVPLPYWPAKSGGCRNQPRPQPFAISWIWPLIDTPHQDACAGLMDNRLAASVAPDGRLGYLLAVGSRYSARAGLTWAIDPSLLDSVRAMRKPYQVGATARCGTGSHHPASADARRWLASLIKATAGQPVFVTPYADVDVAALTRDGNSTDLRKSFADADQVTHHVLGRGAVPASIPAGRRQLSAIAWPAGGIASGALLDSLATANLSTVILTAPAVSPVSYTPGAVTSTLTGIGKQLHILLADHAISALLGSKDAASHTAGAIFRVRQLYLAETAMITAEVPGTPRPIVVAPPRRWDPARKLASGLLADTVSAPWLRPATAGQMAAMPPGHVYRQVTRSVSQGGISAQLLRNVSKLDRRIALLQSIRITADPALDRAVFGIESSAWRGRAARHARALLSRTSRYVETQLRGLSIRGGGVHATYHVTFGGKTSTVPVVIHNALRYPVRVGLLVQASNARVTGELSSIRIPPLSFSSAVKLTVHVESSQGRIRLSLIAPQGAPLAGHPLPAYPLVVLVHPTDFGIVALVICAAALALFVIGSAIRAIRHGRPEPEPDTAPAGAPEPPEPQVLPEPPVPADPETSLPGRAEPQPPGEPPAVPEPHAAGPPGSAWPNSPSGRIAPAGRRETLGDSAAIPQRGLIDLGNRREHTDSVGHDESGLTSAGPSVSDQEPAAPSGRATEERR